MNILLMAATEHEIEPTISTLHTVVQKQTKHHISTLITGIGMTQTAFHLTKYCSKEAPDLIIQAGIAGSFNTKATPGDVYVIENEFFGDLGVEENDEFQDLFDKNFLAPNDAPYIKKALHNPHLPLLNKLYLPTTNAISVNQITTHPKRIQQLAVKYNATLESMEGTALHYVGIMMNVPFIQIRAVSNLVGERNKTNWNIPLAVNNLNNSIIELIESL